MIKGTREFWPGDYLRYDYDLNENSIVIDLGGHHGVFSSVIYEKFKCKVHCFEPVTMLYEVCNKKFENNDKVKVHKTGLSSKNEYVDFHIAGEASSIHVGTVVGETNVLLKKIDDFLLEEKIDFVDLIKINIEGAEYDLLEHILNNNLITKFKNLQIQFHDNVFPGWEIKYKFIKENLKLTHHLTYEFEFKFENWEIN